jgi:hypothetical protein
LQGGAKGDPGLMRTLGIIALCIALIVGAFFIWLHFAYPVYSYRYRLTVAIQTDAELHTGSSVIEVQWVSQPKFGQAPPFYPYIHGQGVFVDLGTRGAIVATLITGDTSVFTPGGAVDATYLAARAFGNNSSTDNIPQLPSLKGRRDLAPDNMPRLLWFPKVANLDSVRIARAEDIPSLFGPNAPLVAAYVEITRDPIVIDIDKKLPWYNQLVGRQKGRLTISYPGQLQLMYNMFVSEFP